MGIKSHYLEDSNGNKFYPYAHANATFDSDGVKVGTRLDEIDQNINSVNTDIGTHIENSDVHITSDEREKLSRIADGAEVNVQPNWNETDETSDSFIKNKPTSLPANGGNADTVNRHSVESNVPQNAVFTDTVYDDTSLSNRVKNIEDDYINSTKLNSHTNDTIVHITSTERTNWNDANTNKHTHSNKTVLDNTTASFTTEEKNKLAGIASGANAYTLPSAGSNLGGVKTGGDVTIVDGVITVNDDSHAHVISNIDGLQSALDEKSSSDHNHDEDYDTIGSADKALKSAKEYTDSAIANEVTARDSAISIAKSSAISTASSDATTKANNALASAKTYADSVGEIVKNDLLNGAGAAYDTLSELGNLINDNQDAIEALETIASGKADKTHSHAISDITNLQSTLDNKADKSHGTHVSYSSTVPVMDGTASVGTATTVARSDHKHPTDTSRASASDLTSHTGDTTKHITSTERTNWNVAKTHADSAHAPSNAEKNQNAFSNIKVGDTTVVADTTTDTLTLVAGSNVTLTPDATNDKITIDATDTVYTHPSYTSKSSGLYKIAVDATGHVSAVTTVAKSDITALGIPSSDTNTHYTSKNVVAGSSTATSNTTSALSNGSVYLISVENGAVTSSHKISGSGATTVTTDASGNIVISSTDTNTTYTLSSFGITATATEINKLDGLTATTTELNYVNGVTSNIQTQLDGKAATSHGTHVTYGTDTPKVAGTGAVGTATGLARIDHVHPAQTTVSGNAGSATKLATARTIDGVSFNGSAAITHYGTCSTAAATAAKTVALTGFTLATGARVLVKFTVTNTASNPTLNVNSTGAKAIMYRGSAITAGYLAANRVYEFVYDGTDWELVGDINTDNNTKNTAGSTNSSSKLFLIGATSQAANPQTYSHDTAYVGTDGCLYSGGVRVRSEIESDTEPTGQLEGDYWTFSY